MIERIVAGATLSAEGLGDFAGFEAFEFGFAADGGAVFEEAEFELSGGDVDVDDLDTGAVAEGDAASGALSAEDAGAVIELPEVVGEVADADESVDEETGGLDEDAEAGDAGDDAIDDIADVFGEELEDFDGAEFTFGIGGAAFGKGDMFAEVDEGGEAGDVAEGFGHEASAAATAGCAAGDFDFWSAGDFATAEVFFIAGFFFLGEYGVEAAVDDEIGIAAEGAGEVGVILTGEGEVADFLGGVFGAGHGFEDGEVKGVGDRGAADGI